MATEFEPHKSRTGHHTRDAGSNMGVLVAIMAILAVGAMLFFTFYDRTPSGPSTASSPPNVTKTVPERTTPKTTNPPANTTTTAPVSPSTK